MPKNSSYHPNSRHLKTHNGLKTSTFPILKELNLGHCKCCTDDEEDIAATQKPLAIAVSLSLLTIQEHPK